MVTMRVSRRQFCVGSAAVSGAAMWPGLWSQAATSTPAVVKTRAGVLRGVSADGVRAFKGVPFAEAPVGGLRFKAPVAKAAWAGERDATQFGAAAMQEGKPALPKSEDCLFLNVWSPEGARPGAGLPVFFWIHGGGFTGGDAMNATIAGDGFAREGVVVVTVQYRLGVLGFLDVEPLLGPAYAGSANNGLRDAILALEWVRENIAEFGGDPKRVTVGGQSAGAKLTDILLGVPSAEGLFHQAISESGGAERVAQYAAALAVSKGFGDVWGKDPMTLKTATADELMKVQGRLMKSWPQHFPLRPELDGKLLAKLPVETMAAGSMRGKRLLIGTNLEESASFIGPHPDHDATAKDLGNTSADKFAEIYAHYKELYPGMDVERLRVRAVTAEEYWVPSTRAAYACVKGGGAVWMYRLDLPETSGDLKGYAHHSEEMPMVWNRKAKGSPLVTPMHMAWLAFLKGSAPKAEGLPAWPEYTSRERATMVLDATSKEEMRPMEKELRLWDGVL